MTESALPDAPTVAHTGQLAAVQVVVDVIDGMWMDSCMHYCTPSHVGEGE